MRSEAADLRREDARAFQRMYTELLYVQSVSAAYGAAPATYLGSRGLPLSWVTLLPQVTSPGFQAEVVGRRVLNARSIAPHFPLTLSALLQVAEGDDVALALARSPLMIAFHGAEEFLDTSWSLASAYGTGRGAELFSRFYFFASSRVVGPARDLLRREFAQVVVQEAGISTDPRLAVFARGLMVKTDEGLLVVTPAGRAVSVAETLAPGLRAKGVLDLDDVRP